MIETLTQPPPRASLRPYWRGVGICLLILAGYIAVISLLGTETARRSSAPPWFSWVRMPPTKTTGQRSMLIVPVVVFAGCVVTIRRIGEAPDVHPGLIRTIVVATTAFLGVLAMNVSIAMTDGSSAAIWRPFDRGSEYFSDVAAVHGISQFLHNYVANLYRYSIHARTHPPGPVILLYWIGRIIHPGVVTAAWSAVVITASGVIPFYLLARRLIGERAAIIAIGLYAVTPSLVIFGATSMDGVFLVPMLWTAYFSLRAIEEKKIWFALAAGIWLAIAMMLTYASVCVIVLMGIYCLLRGEILKSIITAITAALLLLCVKHFTGFDYLAGLARSRFYDHYSMHTEHVAISRYLDISISNLAAFLIGVGLPAVILWIRRTRSGPAHPLNTALIATVLAMSFGHLFTHETERIWLIFIALAQLPAAEWIAHQDEPRLLDWAMCVAFAQTWLMQIFLFTIW